MPNLADEGNNAMPAAASTNPETTIGRRPRPRALARSEAAPAQGTSRSSSTLSMAMTAPMAVRCSPSASRTSGGTNVLMSGPVTPAKSPPRPTSTQRAYGVCAARVDAHRTSTTHRRGRPRAGSRASIDGAPLIPVGRHEWLLHVFCGRQGPENVDGTFVSAR